MHGTDNIETDDPTWALYFIQYTLVIVIRRGHLGIP